MTTELKALRLDAIDATFEHPSARRGAVPETVRVFLSQAPHPDSLHQRRTRLFGGDHDAPPSSAEIKDYLEVLAKIPPDADVAVLCEHSAASTCLETLRNVATANRQVIVAALGFSRSAHSSHNSVAVAIPDRAPVILHKLSFSTEDQVQANDGKLLRGDRLAVFDSPFGRFAALNCHEYTHSELLAELAKQRLDFLIVTSFNPAWQLYHEYALADIHRLFCFVVLCNVGNYGGSSVFAPFAKLGPLDGGVSAGGALYLSRGPSAVHVTLDLPVAELRRLRRYKYRSNPLARFKAAADWYQPIVPPETFLKTHPPYQKVLNSIETVDLARKGYRRRNTGDDLKIGIGQLHSAPLAAYLANSYHITRWKGHAGLESRVRSMLAVTDRDLDFLVLPEVFATLGLDEDFRRFSQDNGTIVMTGVEYEKQKRGVAYGSAAASGANRCFIYIPTKAGVERLTYTKLTRSQYDALSMERDEDDRLLPFDMDLGKKLYRFTHPDIGDFGVLICYDLSHNDIVHAVNTRDRPAPLDLMFVLCHNPYGDLYRACCLADCHRYYQFVAMCNVAGYGGSGLFGPIRTKGTARTLVQAGRNAEGIFVGHANLAGLRAARKGSDRDLPTGTESFQRRPGLFNIRWPHAAKAGAGSPRPRPNASELSVARRASARRPHR